MPKLSFLDNLTKSHQSGVDFTVLESLLNRLPTAAIIASDIDQRILCANSKASELTAYTRSNLINLPLVKLFSPTEGISIDNCFDKNSLTEIHPGFEGDLIHHNGSRIASILTASRLAGSDHLYLILLNSQEELQRASIAARQQQNIWSNLNQLITAREQPDLHTALQQILTAGAELSGWTALCIYQVDGQSPLMRKMVNLDQGATLPDEISAQDLGALNKPILWVRGKHPTTNLHRQARAANLAYVASAPIGTENATIGLFLAAGYTPPPASILDIVQFLTNLVYFHTQSYILTTQLQKDVIAGKLSQVACETVFDSIDDGLIFLTPDLQITRINASAELTLGYAYPEVIGQSIKNVLICNENLETNFRFAQEDFRPDNITGLRLYRRNGDSFLANLRILPIISETELHSILVILNDLSEQEEYKTRNQILEQRATLADITASFAHEVRNPINNISTGLQLLALNLPPDDPNQENISRLQNDCERLADLVKSGLSFVRPVEYKLEPVHLDKVISNLMDRWRNRLARTQVKYNPQIDPDVPPVEGDLRALEQVFTNLIDNGIQAMEPAGGVLTVNLRRTVEDGRSQVEVTILDTGPGIPSDVKEHIFEPFFTTKRSGTGLGLAIVKRIITAHKGSIHVSSIPGGTMFQVHIPSL